MTSHPLFSPGFRIKVNHHASSIKAVAPPAPAPISMPSPVLVTAPAEFSDGAARYIFFISAFHSKPPAARMTPDFARTRSHPLPERTPTPDTFRPSRSSLTARRDKNSGTPASIRPFLSAPTSASPRASTLGFLPFRAGTFSPRISLSNSREVTCKPPGRWYCGLCRIVPYSLPSNLPSNRPGSSVRPPFEPPSHSGW